MKIEVLKPDSPPNPEVAAALENFEQQFRYPLGGETWFRISHGADYTRFFRAIGETRCFVAMRGQQVAGVITSTICPLRTPGRLWRRAAYVSDLKVADSVSGRTLLRLIRELTDWTLIQPTPAFTVVMDGTARSPVDYTGRLGIPAFKEVGKLAILRIPCELFAADGHYNGKGRSGKRVEVRQEPIESVKQSFQQLTAGHFATDGGNAELRSEMKPVGLIHPSGKACGIVEDTRQCKRLFREDGSEMESAHLSCFGYHSAEDAVEMISAAAQIALQSELPAMFVAVPAMEADSLLELLPKESIVKAPATVFGYALSLGGIESTATKWSINTAEI